MHCLKVSLEIISSVIFSDNNEYYYYCSANFCFPHVDFILLVSLFHNYPAQLILSLCVSQFDSSLFRVFSLPNTETRDKICIPIKCVGIKIMLLAQRAKQCFPVFLKADKCLLIAALCWSWGSHQ